MKCYLHRAYLVLLIFISTSNIEAIEVGSPAEVMGYQFGSLSCQNLSEPDQKYACEAQALSNGNGCYGLPDPRMRQACADYKKPDTFYPFTPRIKLDLTKFKQVPTRE